MKGPAAGGRPGTGAVTEAEVADELMRLIAELRPERRELLRPDGRLQADLGLDSVAIIELVLAAEDAFDITIPDDETGELLDATVQELARRVVELRQS